MKATQLSNHTLVTTSYAVAVEAGMVSPIDEQFRIARCRANIQLSGVVIEAVNGIADLESATCHCL